MHIIRRYTCMKTAQQLAIKQTQVERERRNEKEMTYVRDRIRDLRLENQCTNYFFIPSFSIGLCLLNIWLPINGHRTLTSSRTRYYTRDLNTVTYMYYVKCLYINVCEMKTRTLISNTQGKNRHNLYTYTYTHQSIYMCVHMYTCRCFLVGDSTHKTERKV